MSKTGPEVMGIQLKELEDPIQVALRTYAEPTDGRISFGDIAAVSQLELTPTKPNSARASTSVSFQGAEVATLWVIAFAPGDATGDETHGHTLEELNMGSLPLLPRFVPRDKRGVPRELDIQSEIHLALLSQAAGRSANLRLFAGHLRMLGITNRADVTDIGYVGQDRDTFRDIMRGAHTSSPTATLTTGREDMLRFPATTSWGGVFGTPHAVYNNQNTCGSSLQVCGFIGLTDELTERTQADIALNFGTEEPELTVE